jgi:hypothetical protein
MAAVLFLLYITIDKAFLSLWSYLNFPAVQLGWSLNRKCYHHLLMQKVRLWESEWVTQGHTGSHKSRVGLKPGNQASVNSWVQTLKSSSFFCSQKIRTKKEQVLSRLTWKALWGSPYPSYYGLKWFRVLWGTQYLRLLKCPAECLPAKI